MFNIDDRISSTTGVILEWPLSTLLLKNESTYPWLILVPRRIGIKEIHQLARDDQFLLMDEIHHSSLLVSQYFKPDKLNIAALGNAVPQLHIHVVGRGKQDPLWPHGIWQTSLVETPYEEKLFSVLLNELREHAALACDSFYLKNETVKF